MDTSFATNGAPYGSLNPFQGTTGAGLPVLAAFNCDLDPTTGGNIWYEDPSPSGGVRITWDNILNWQDTAAGAPTALVNFIQMELVPGGQVYFSYGANLGLGGSANNSGLVGFSAGGGEPIGDLVDWSALNGYQSGDGTVPLTMAADGRPLIGTTVNLVTSNVPGTAIGTFSVLAFEGLRGYWNADLAELFVFRVAEHMDRLAFSNSVIESAVVPANPASTFPWYRRRTLLAPRFSTVSLRDTWPSPPITASPFLRTASTVVDLESLPCSDMSIPLPTHRFFTL